MSKSLSCKLKKLNSLEDNVDALLSQLSLHPATSSNCTRSGSVSRESYTVKCTCLLPSPKMHPTRDLGLPSTDRTARTNKAESSKAKVQKCKLQTAISPTCEAKTRNVAGAKLMAKCNDQESDDECNQNSAKKVRGYTELDTLRFENKRFQHAMEDLQKKYVKVCKEQCKQSHCIAELAQENENLQRTLSCLEEEHRSLKSKSKSIETELKEKLNSSLCELEQAHLCLTKKNTELSEALASSELYKDMYEKLRCKTETSGNEYECLKMKLQESEETNRCLEKNLANVESILNTVQSKYTNSISEIACLQQELELQLAKNQCCSECDKLQYKLSLYEEQIEYLEQRLSSKDKKLSEFEKNEINKSDKVTHAAQTNTACQLRHSMSQTFETASMSETLQSQLSKAQKQCTAQQKRISDLENQCRQFSSQENMLRKQNTKLQESQKVFSDQNLRCATLENQVNCLKTDCAQLQAAYDELKQEKDTLEEDLLNTIKNLQDDIAQNEKKFKKCCEGLYEECNNLKDTIEEKEKCIQRANQQCQQLQKEVSQLGQEVMTNNSVITKLKKQPKKFDQGAGTSDQPFTVNRGVETEDSSPNTVNRAVESKLIEDETENINKLKHEIEMLKCMSYEMRSSAELETNEKANAVIKQLEECLRSTEFERDHAIKTARFTTQKLVEAVKKYEKELCEARFTQDHLNAIICDKDCTIRKANVVIQDLSETICDLNNACLRQPGSPGSSEGTDCNSGSCC